VWAVVVPAAHAGPPLRRTLDSYIFFGLRNVGLKNMSVSGPCNAGVNCQRPSENSSCGVITHENPQYGDGSQIVGDVARFSKGGGIIYQLFTNVPNGLENVFINAPPVASPDPLPLLADVDKDGTPSCRSTPGGCVVDTGDLAAACDFPVPFPACDPGRKVTVSPDSDCGGAPDAVAGNGRCDLAAGTYGDLQVQNDSKLTLQGGTYTFCGFAFGRRTETRADAAAMVNVSGEIAIGSGSVFGPPVGTNCGQIRVNAAGNAGFSFGREGTINGFFCGPERSLRLGHGNSLSGRFYGDEVSADSNNRAFCCATDCIEPPPPASPALRRDLDAYFVLAMRRAALKNLNLGSVCNIGVNCATGNSRSECGVLSTAGVTMVDYSQIAGDQTFFRKGGARIWRSFRNNDSPLQNVQLVGPAPNPDGFTPPIIPGTCDANCNPNVAGIKAACGFPTPFPSCDPSRSVRASRGEDCGPADAVPGNQQCDLPPGTYGTFSVQNGGRANLTPGQYVFCNFRTGRRAKVTAQGTTVLIPDGGMLRITNGSELAEGCGDLTVLVDGAASSVNFGRTGLMAAKVCAPEASISLGHGNVLIGQFIGDTVSADLFNVARCCGACQ
jgi:hypothetical protein